MDLVVNALLIILNFCALLLFESWPNVLGIAFATIALVISANGYDKAGA